MFDAPAPPANRWLLLLTVAAGVLLITLDNSVLYTALPTLTRHLHASTSQGLWIINAYPLVMAGLLLGAGTLGDRIGHRRMFLIGLAVFGIASLGAAFAPTAGALIAARAFLAVGAAAMMPATLALIRVTFTDERERNMAIGLWGSMAIVGSAIGPVIGGVLLAHFWWGSVFLVNVPVVIAAIGATLAVAPRDAPDASRTWDWPSSLLALVALSALVVAIKQAVQAGAAGALPAVALAAAIAASALFALRQRALAQPLLDFSLLRNPAFLAGVVSAITTTFAIAGVQLAATQRFQLVAGYTPMQAGLLVSIAALGALPTALLGGALLHRAGLRPLICGGLALGAAATALTGWGLEHGMAWVFIGLLLSGSGLGAAMGVASSAILGSAPAQRAGMAASVEEVSYEFGSLIAVALLGSLLSAMYTAHVAVPAGLSMVETMDASASMQGALEVAAHLPGATAAALAQAAGAAFDRGYAAVMFVAAAMQALAALVTGMLLRKERAAIPVF